jgi:hypothetical protein
VTIRYMLETVIGGKAKTGIVIPTTQAVAVSCRPAKSREWTFGMEAIRENSGIREWNIDVRGHSGLKFRLGSDKVGGDLFASGVELFLEFRRYLVAHEEAAAVADRKSKEKPRVSQREAGQSASQADLDTDIERNESDGTEAALREEAFASGESYPVGGPGSSGSLAAFEPIGPGSSAPDAFDDQSETTLAQGAPEILESEDTTPELVFRALDEDIALFVDIEDFGFERDVSGGNTTFEWTLSLRSYRDATDIKPKDAEAFGGGAVDNLVKDATKTIDGVSQYVAVADRELERYADQGDALKEPIRSVQRLSTSVGSIVDTAQGITKLPAELFDEVYRVIESAVQLVYDGIETATFGAARAAARPAFNDASASMQEWRLGALEAMAFLGAKTQFNDAASLGQDPPLYDNALIGSQVELSTLEPVVEVQLGQGETLADLAEIYLGSRAQWPQLLILNGLDGPMTHGDGSPLLPGDKLIVPFKAGLFAWTGILAPAGSDPYGTDVLLSRNAEEGLWDIAVAAGDNPTDYALVDGPANYRQAIIVRFLSVQGESALFGNVGLPPLVGTSGVLELVGMVAMQAREQAIRDPRTSDVQKAQVIDDGDALVISLELLSFAGKSVPLIVPFTQPIGG